MHTERKCDIIHLCHLVTVSFLTLNHSKSYLVPEVIFCSVKNLLVDLLFSILLALLFHFNSNYSKMDESNMFGWMEGDSLAPPCQSEDEVIEQMLQIITPFITPASYLFDLGCGDGRICIAASERFGCRSCGIEIEAVLVEKFRTDIERTNLSHLVSAINGDLLQVDIDPATVIIVYLLPEALELIKIKLVSFLRRGGILLCNSWGLKGIKEIEKRTGGFANNVHFYLYDNSCVEEIPS